MSWGSLAIGLVIGAAGSFVLMAFTLAYWMGGGRR